MSSKKRTSSTTTASLDLQCWCGLEDGLDDGASLSSSSSNKSVCSSHRHRLGRFASQDRVTRTRVLDPKYLPTDTDIDTLVNKMVCAREDHDRAETKQLCSKLFEIIQEMKRDDEVVPRGVNKNKVGLVAP
eukprot:scaffold33497_cov166-Skeletonema_menzelii.AAC.1